MVMLRFDEPSTQVLPSDAEGVLKDLNAPPDTELPEVVRGIVGFAREFGEDIALAAQDDDVGASLFTRTVSIQTIMRWDIDDQAAAATPGTIIARGIGGSSSERVAYGLELRVVNAGARVGEARFYWENLDGDRFTAAGGQFRMGRASETLLITAVRRWISENEVVMRYYLGDQLLNEAVGVPGGAIGGGTTGTTLIGAATQTPAPTSATLDTLDITPTPVETDDGNWTAELTALVTGAAGNSVEIALIIADGAPLGIEVRDHERYDGGLSEWVAAPNTIGVLVGGNGDPLAWTVAQLEAAINTASALAQVTTPDATPGRVLVEQIDKAGEFSGGVGAMFENFLEGAIDELRVVGRELVAEEIAMTWHRIRVLQPAGEQLIRDCMPPGLPISDDPDSRVYRETKWMGQALGYSAAQTENQRLNLIPDRSYGPALQRWEGVSRQAVRPGDDVDKRRGRVLGHFARRAGVSPPGVRAAMHELLACDEDQLELMAYNNTIRDGFDVLRERRWRRVPEADWSVAGGELEVAIAAAENPAVLTPEWRTCLTGVSGPERIGGYGAQIFAKVTPAFTDDGMEAGLVLYDWPRGDVLMLGVRRDGGDTKVVSQRYIAGVAQAPVVHATTADDPHWLHLYQVPLEYSGQAPDELVPHAVRWSTTGPSSGFAAGDPGDFAFTVGWMGFYARTFDGAALVDPLAASFDDAALWMPHGTRTFHFYVLRDPDLPGDYDLAGANASIAKLKQSQTHAAVITSRAFLAGNPESLCGRGPLGED